MESKLEVLGREKTHSRNDTQFAIQNVRLDNEISMQIEYESEEKKRERLGKGNVRASWVSYGMEISIYGKHFWVMGKFTSRVMLGKVLMTPKGSLTAFFISIFQPNCYDVEEGR